MISTANKTARALKFFFLAALLAAGCARLKQCAYEGFSRDQWQQPDKVIAALGLKPGDTVADLGSGGGYFTFRLAHAVVKGKVYAVDVDRDMLALVAERAKKEAPSIVETVVAKPNDPVLPGTVDLVFTSNTYHHLDNRVAYFTNLRKYLHPGGRVAIIDFDRRAWIEGLLRHYTPSEFIQREMEQAGYVLQKNNDFLDRQSFLIFAVKENK